MSRSRRLVIFIILFLISGAVRAGTLALELLPAWTGEADQAGAAFGTGVSGAGDVNGDGYADVIVGAPSYSPGGRAFVYHGSLAGLGETPAWSPEPDPDGVAIGYPVAAAGDVNGDGFADVIVSALGWDTGPFGSGVAVYHGSRSGLETSPAWTVEETRQPNDFGAVIATAGDVNGDGFADLIVGTAWSGRVFVYHGSPSGLLTAPSWTARTRAFASAVATAGDVNGDGYSDIVIGARGYGDRYPDSGAAFVYHGSPTGLQQNPAWMVTADQDDAAFGGSVASAGDVDGDGYDDVVVGAPRYSHGEGEEGRAYLFRGSAGGLKKTPSWHAEGGQGEAFFGASVATAGDVNADGYADVIVGAPEYTNDQAREGGAFVYLGSRAGLSLSPAWIADGDLAHSDFGVSVAAAGDVNGDGAADVIVGTADQDGFAQVYHGIGITRP